MSENADLTGGAAHTVENNSDATMPVEQEMVNLPQKSIAQRSSEPPHEEERQSSNLNMLLGVQLILTVELGRTELPVKDVLELQKGTVIELDKIAGESVDVFVNESLIGHGDVVVVDDKFGVRITELVSIEKRL